MSEPMRFSDQIMLAAAGSCTCGAKSPEFIWHDAHCRYSMLLVCADRADIVADEITRLTAALAEAEEERDGLAVALLPFAEHAEHVEVWCLTNTANVHVVTENGTGAVLSRVTLGDFRHARAALTRPAAQPEGEHD